MTTAWGPWGPLRPGTPGAAPCVSTGRGSCETAIAARRTRPFRSAFPAVLWGPACGRALSPHPGRGGAISSFSSSARLRARGLGAWVAASSAEQLSGPSRPCVAPSSSLHKEHPAQASCPRHRAGRHYTLTASRPHLSVPHQPPASVSQSEMHQSDLVAQHLGVHRRWGLRGCKRRYFINCRLVCIWKTGSAQSPSPGDSLCQSRQFCTGRKRRRCSTGLLRK